MTTEAQITAWLATQQDAMLAELKEMVNTDGGSYDKAGVDKTGAQVKRFLEGHGIAVEVVPREKHGDHTWSFDWLGLDAAEQKEMFARYCATFGVTD